LHQVQVLDIGEEESEFPFGFFPFFLLPDVEEESKAVLASGVRARMPAFGLIGIRTVFIRIRLHTWMPVIVDVDV